MSSAGPAGWSSKTVEAHARDGVHDRIHDAYHGDGVDPETHRITRARIHWTVDRTPRGRILDAGCSQGVVALLLAARGDDVVGIDIDPDAIAFAGERAGERPPEVRDRLELAVADVQRTELADASFDHAVCGELLEHVEDVDAAVAELTRVVKPGGVLVATTPFGILPHPDHRRVFYEPSLTALLEPAFDLRDVVLLERHLAVVAARRRRPGSGRYRLAASERMYERHERRYLEQLDAVRARLAEANAAYRASTGRAGRTGPAGPATPAGPTGPTRSADADAERLARLCEARGERVDILESAVDELRSDRDDLAARHGAAVEQGDAMARYLSARLADAEQRLAAETGTLTEAREKYRMATRALLRRDERIEAAERRVAAFERSRIWALASRWWRLRKALRLRRGRLRPSLARVLRGPGRRLPRKGGADSATPPPPADASAGRALVSADGSGAPLELESFEAWRRRAAAAEGDDVVLMFSGTTFIQERRGNRPIRLSKVLLERECPVFFNYWRWRPTDPGPEYEHPLLFQSPIDLTPRLLQRLLEADFGGKRKLLFASFPHELMVRWLSEARQRGWVTIYDARDDWEEFHAVGAARWYDAGFERYLAREAEVVTAVSRPLAAKIAALGGREDVVVVPNALDPRFPRPPSARAPVQPPIVGYFGHLTPKWFDWELVSEAARRHPDWTFELAGHQAPDDLALPANVKLLGLLEPEQLAELSVRWSFALIPFKVGPLGDAVDPIKIYEYLHLGLPVLSTRMPQIADYPGTVMTETREGFLGELDAMLARALDRRAADEWLAGNTWAARIEAYDRLAGAASARAPTGVEAILAA